MMPAAKMLDPLIGIDFHLIVPSPGVPPLLIPHPSIGIIFDPFDLIPKLGADVWISGLPRAQAGSSGLMIPHFPIGGLFVKPPENELEIFMGSKIVSADDEALSFLGLPVLSCQSIGVPPIPRPKKSASKAAKKPPKPRALVGMVLPTSLVLAIPTGVFVDGPPTISLMALGFRAALGLGKLAGKGLRKAQRASKRWKRLSERVHKAGDKLCDKLKLGDVARNRVHRATCTATGHPVDVATGKLFTDFTDLELPGPLPLSFERVWYSTSTYQGPFGHGWHHTYDAALYVTEQLLVYRTPDGRSVTLPALEPGDEYFDRTERVTLRHDDRGYRIETSAGLSYRFGLLDHDRRRPRLDPSAPAVHALREIVNRAGHRIVLNYQEDGRLSELVDSAGRSIQLHHGKDGRIQALSAPHPDFAEQRFEVARYGYDEAGNLTSMIDARGNTFGYAYEGHLLVRETDRTGLSFYFLYDGRNERARCIRTWGDGGIYDRTLSYQPTRTTVVDSLGHTTLYEHEAGLVARTVDALGAVSLTRYEHSQLVEFTDALGKTTSYRYDERGNAVETIEADGTKTSVEYDDRDLPIEAVDVLGGRWKWRYDELGQLLEHTDPLGASTRLTYARGLLVELEDATRQRSTLAYDAQGNLALLVTADGSASRWQYNHLGSRIEAIDPNRNSERHQHDLCGNLRRVTEPDGNAREFEYDGEGRATQVRDHHYEVHLTYRGMGRLASRTQAGTTVRFEYDSEEQLLSIANERGAVYAFERGPLGEVLVERGFDGVRRAYEYDALGRIQRVHRASGIVTAYRYDTADRVVSVQHSDGSEEKFTYRQDGALTAASNKTCSIRFERDLVGRVVREHQGNHWVESDFDPLGRRVRLRSSLGAEAHIQRNALGDTTCVTLTRAPGQRSAAVTPAEQEAAEPAFHAHFVRDALGLELSRTLPGGVQSRWQRDKLGRPLQHELFANGRVHRARSYNWHESGRLLRIIDAASGPISFKHDALGQLAEAAHADGRVELRMPDAVGNLFRRKDRSDRRYGPAGQLLEAIGPDGSVTRYEYDAEGNLLQKRRSSGATWRYVWGADGHLAQVVRPDGSLVRFEYDPLGRRTAKHCRGQTTRWIWDGDVPLHEWVDGELDRLLADGPGGSAGSADADVARRQAELSERPVRGPPARGSLERPITWLFEPESFAPLARVLGEDRESIVTDHLGAPLAVVDARGELTWSADLDSWGELSVRHGERQHCPFRWPGQYEDVETGLYYNRFRYYDPEAGQYASQDPLGLSSTYGNGATVVRRHRAGNQVLVNGRRWYVPSATPLHSVPRVDILGEFLQDATSRAAARWNPALLNARVRARIALARRTGRSHRADLWERQARGRWVEAEVRRQFPELPWNRRGVDLTVGGVNYDILSGTQWNMDQHARRMANTMFRMITF